MNEPTFIGAVKGQLYDPLFGYSVPSFCVRALLPPDEGTGRSGTGFERTGRPLKGRLTAPLLENGQRPVLQQGRHFQKESSAWRKEP